MLVNFLKISKYSLDILLNVLLPQKCHFLKKDCLFLKKIILLIYDNFLKICLCFKKIYLLVITNHFFNNFLYKKCKIYSFKPCIFNKKNKFTKPLCYTFICYLKKSYSIESSLLWLGLQIIQFYLSSMVINIRVYKFWMNNILFKKKIKNTNTNTISIIFNKNLSKIKIRYPTVPVMLQLLKFWNLIESMYYSPKTSAIFKSWFHSSKFFIIKFFISIKLKVTATNISWSLLKKSYKKWFIVKFYYFIIFDLNMNIHKSSIEYKSKALKINIRDFLALQEQLIYSKFYYLNITFKLRDFGLYFQSNKLLILCYIELAKNFLKKILILFKNIIINGLFQKLGYPKKCVNLFLVQLPLIINKGMGNPAIQMIETKLLCFISTLLQYVTINYIPIILIRSFLKENKFKAILRCNHLDIFLKRFLGFSNSVKNIKFYSQILYYIYFLPRKKTFYLYKNIENYYKISYFF